MLDECDIALINALQVNSRASWSLIGRALGISPDLKKVGGTR